jgi:hypothetical protein
VPKPGKQLTRGAAYCVNVPGAHSAGLDDEDEEDEEEDEEEKVDGSEEDEDQDVEDQGVNDGEDMNAAAVLELPITASGAAWPSPAYTTPNTTATSSRMALTVTNSVRVRRLMGAGDLLNRPPSEVDEEDECDCEEPRSSKDAASSASRLVRMTVVENSDMLIDDR